MSERTLDVHNLFEAARGIAFSLLNNSEFSNLSAAELFELAIELALEEMQNVSKNSLVVGKVDTNNVAFSLENDDVALLKGGLDFAQHIGKTVWNYNPEDDE